MLSLPILFILICFSLDSNESTSLPGAPGAKEMKEKMNEEKFNEMFNCFFAILCIAKKPLEFRILLEIAHPELVELGMVWFKIICNFTAENTDEWWEKYPSLKCPLSEEVKLKYFSEWMKKLGEYWAKVCNDENSEKCILFMKVQKAYMEIEAKYRANGVCQARGKNSTDKAVKEGKGKADELAKTIPQGPGGLGRK